MLAHSAHISLTKDTISSFLSRLSICDSRQILELLEGKVRAEIPSEARDEASVGKRQSSVPTTSNAASDGATISKGGEGEVMEEGRGNVLEGYKGRVREDKNDDIESLTDLRCAASDIATWRRRLVLLRRFFKAGIRVGLDDFVDRKRGGIEGPFGAYGGVSIGEGSVHRMRGIFFVAKALIVCCSWH